MYHQELPQGSFFQRRQLRSSALLGWFQTRFQHCNILCCNCTGRSQSSHWTIIPTRAPKPNPQTHSLKFSKGQSLGLFQVHLQLESALRGFSRTFVKCHQIALGWLSLRWQHPALVWTFLDLGGYSQLHGTRNVLCPSSHPPGKCQRHQTSTQRLVSSRNSKKREGKSLFVLPALIIKYSSNY